VCWDVYNAAWERNWGFVPMSRAEFAHLARDLKQLVDPRFAFAAEIDGEPAGFVLALLDYNVLFKRIRTGRLSRRGCSPCSPGGAGCARCASWRWASSAPTARAASSPCSCASSCGARRRPASPAGSRAGCWRTTT
jgi:hypothetical protein